eukprot:GFYU01004918.1.p1 GENE.GFYU01004918.1~~GFYU01004918.1.p1  ORF type:complete len:101 (-),score=43.31 GFYU01004918.1:293-595(-)
MGCVFHAAVAMWRIQNKDKDAISKKKALADGAGSGSSKDDKCKAAMAKLQLFQAQMETLTDEILVVMREREDTAEELDFKGMCANQQDESETKQNQQDGK